MPTPVWEAILRTESLPSGNAGNGNNVDNVTKEDGLQCGIGGQSDDHPIFGPSKGRCSLPLGMWRTFGRGWVNDDDDDNSNNYKCARSRPHGNASAGNEGRHRPHEYAFALLLNSVAQIPDVNGDVYATETSTRF